MKDWKAKVSPRASPKLKRKGKKDDGYAGLPGQTAVGSAAQGCNLRNPLADKLASGALELLLSAHGDLSFVSSNPPALVKALHWPSQRGMGAGSVLPFQGGLQGQHRLQKNLWEAGSLQ